MLLPFDFPIGVKQLPNLLLNLRFRDGEEVKGLEELAGSIGKSLKEFKNGVSDATGHDVWSHTVTTAEKARQIRGVRADGFIPGSGGRFISKSGEIYFDPRYS